MVIEQLIRPKIINHFETNNIFQQQNCSEKGDLFDSVAWIFGGYYKVLEYSLK